MNHRMPNYNYSQPGFYCITICIFEHRCRFGKIIDDQMNLNPFGEIAQHVWLTLPKRYPFVTLDTFVFMPNHMHGIIQLGEQDTESTAERIPLGKIIRAYKGTATRLIRESRKHQWFAWEDNYFDTVIRTEAKLNRYRRYIRENPSTWRKDRWYRMYAATSSPGHMPRPMNWGGADKSGPTGSMGY